MSPRLAIPVVVIAAGALLWWALGGGDRPHHYTGFVEGEERVIRAEVTGRILDVPVREGETLVAGTVIARIDPRDVEARVASKTHEIAMLEADARRADERLGLVDATWQRDRDARRAEVRQAEASATLAARSYSREAALAADGVTAAQRVDDQRARRDETTSALERARALSARTDAEERTIALTRHERDVAHERVALARAQLAELQVQQTKHTVPSPDVPTVVQTQLAWPGELAQPGTPLATVLDPRDTYVQVWIPVIDVDRFPLGRRVSVRLDSRPDAPLDGEVAFVADVATFTPEKVETRDDRLGQVYRVKVRILDANAGLRPGTEGDVTPVGADP